MTRVLCISKGGAECYNAHRNVLRCVAVWCSVLRCVAVWCSVLRCVAVWCSGLRCVAVWCSVLHHTILVYSIVRIENDTSVVYSAK